MTWHDRLYCWWYGVWARFGEPLKALEFRFNHPDYYAFVKHGRPIERGARSERLCWFVDAISSNYFHD